MRSKKQIANLTFQNEQVQIELKSAQFARLEYSNQGDYKDREISILRNELQTVLNEN